MYINWVIKLRYYIKKRSKETEGKGYILLLVAGLIGAMLYIGHITMLRRVFCHFYYILSILLYTAYYSDI